MRRRWHRTALIFVGEFWIAAGLYLGAALIWILWMEFVRGPLKTQRENVLKARGEAPPSAGGSCRGSDTVPSNDCVG